MITPARVRCTFTPETSPPGTIWREAREISRGEARGGKLQKEGGKQKNEGGYTTMEEIHKMLVEKIKVKAEKNAIKYIFFIEIILLLVFFVYVN